MLVFTCFAPHPPIILPQVGSEKDRAQVKKTINALKRLGKIFREAEPDYIIISSPHPDWGFNVPLYFLAPDFKGEIKTYLIGAKEPKFYFEEGKKVYKSELQIPNSKIAIIASGDLSHCLKEEGPYGFHPDGPKFDQALIKYLKEKDIENFLKMDDYFPGAGECGLRSFCFILGILGASGIDWQPEILSYEAPFGVGYLVVNFRI